MYVRIIYIVHTLRKFMRIPMKVDYGVRALIHIAQKNPNQLVRTSEIAEGQKIPEAYLDQVLTILKKHGIISSKRGPNGGHELARSPDRIKLNDVVYALDQKPESLKCKKHPGVCNFAKYCNQKTIWDEIEKTVDDYLSKITIHELIKPKVSHAGDF